MPATTPVVAAARPLPIQRLIILHLDLVELSLGDGKCHLGESASVEELAESILYYFHDSSGDADTDADGEDCSGQQVAGATAAEVAEPQHGHCHPHHAVNGHDVEQPAVLSYASQEAIQFAGLCTALYALPTSLREVENSARNKDDNEEEEEEKEDRTREVYLSNCSLIIERLEVPETRGPHLRSMAAATRRRDAHIVAVAQIARRRTVAGGATPSAVGSAIRNYHRLFCLLRGGGIHQRLLSSSLSSSVHSGCGGTGTKERHHGGLYPGMDQLFEVRKHARRMNENRPLNKDLEQHDGQLRLIEQGLSDLCAGLPITSLRTDLRVYYDAFLSELSTLVGPVTGNVMNGGGGVGGTCRSIVESIPAPIALNSGRHRYESAPSSIIPSHAWDYFQESLQREILQTDPQGPGVIAIGTFVRGQFVSTLKSFDNDKVAGISPPAIPNTAIHLLMWYMSSFRCKIRQPSILDGGARMRNVSGAVTQRLPSSKLSQSLQWTFGAADSAYSNKRSGATPPPLPSTTRGFLPPPPLSSLSASDDLHDFQGPRHCEQRVWAPSIHLRLPGQTSHRKARMCLYDLHDDDLSFLVLIDDNDSNEDDGCYLFLFDFIDTTLMRLASMGPNARVNSKSRAGNASDDDDLHSQPLMRIETRYWREPGLEIVIVDRESCRLILFSSLSDERPQVDDDERGSHYIKTLDNTPKSTTTVSGTNQFLGLRERFFNNASPSSGGTNNSSSSNKVNRSSSNGKLQSGDCRHLLASHLSLDSILVLDDMMNEIGFKKQQQRRNKEKNYPGNKHNTRPKHHPGCSSIEICTLLNGSWAFGYTDNDPDSSQYELYILLDTSVYVTIADVQSMTRRIRNELLL